MSDYSDLASIISKQYGQEENPFYQIGASVLKKAAPELDPNGNRSFWGGFLPSATQGFLGGTALGYGKKSSLVDRQALSDKLSDAPALGTNEFADYVKGDKELGKIPELGLLNSSKMSSLLDDDQKIKQAVILEKAKGLSSFGKDVELVKDENGRVVDVREKDKPIAVSADEVSAEGPRVRTLQEIVDQDGTNIQGAVRTQQLEQKEALRKRKDTDQAEALGLDPEFAKVFAVTPPQLRPGIIKEKGALDGIKIASQNVTDVYDKIKKIGTLGTLNPWSDDAKAFGAAKGSIFSTLQAYLKPFSNADAVRADPMLPSRFDTPEQLEMKKQEMLSFIDQKAPPTPLLTSMGYTRRGASGEVKADLGDGSDSPTAGLDAYAKSLGGGGSQYSEQDLSAAGYTPRDIAALKAQGRVR